jgi:hypothetical protein
MAERRFVEGAARGGPHRFAHALAALLLGLCVGAAAPAQDPPSAAVAETASDPLRECAERQAPGSSLQSFTLSHRNKRGEVNGCRGRLYWRRHAESGLSDLAVCFAAPPDVRGAAILVNERADGEAEMFAYLPELGKVDRITSHMAGGSLCGSDFASEDFARLHCIGDGAVTETLPREAIAGRPVHVNAARPAPESQSGYERVVSYVDVETCVPLRVEFFAAGGRVRKRLEVDPDLIVLEQDFHVPRRITMVDLRDGTSSEIHVERVEIDADIPPVTFTTSWLPRCR